jgi:rSAM/selenodomain-associated transferase 2
LSRAPAVQRRPAAELSVIVPVLDEAAALPGLLRQLQAQRGLRLELLVVDGGSSDASVALAAAAGARVVQAPRGRARQLNAGAQAARSDWLLFLHADSGLADPQLLANARQALAASADQRLAGHFGLRFLRQRPGAERFYRFLEAKSRLNRPGTIHGDQGLLLRRRFFESLGGFDPRLPVMEDEDFAARVFAQGGWRLLPGELLTSARRFEQEGRARRYALMALMMAMWAAELPEFFEQARGIYRPPGAAVAPLPLAPYWQLARRLLRQQQPAQRRASCRRIGRLAAANAWQIPYALSGQNGAVLQRFEQWFTPLLKGRGAETLAGALVALAMRLPPDPT